ncbi:MAG TPA: hypothetical protein VGB45_13645 [Abditibacterium sp.]|jgi:hypothetical protein
MMKRTLRVNPATQTVKRIVSRRACRDVKGFIFLATTGRSGTLSFDEILKAVPHCVSLHEPEPIMNGEVLRRHNEGDDTLMEQVFREFKLPTIYKTAAGAHWYIESNHLFIKSFCEAAAREFGDRMQVLHITRDRHAVARSFLKRGSIPGTKWGNEWLGNYRAPLNQIDVADALDNDARFAHPYFKVLWYWYEIEARTLVFRARHPQIRVHDFQTESFNDADALHALCRDIFGNYDTKIVEQMVGTRAHASASAPELPPGVEQIEIDEFDALCQAQLQLLQRQI